MEIKSTKCTTNCLQKTITSLASWILFFKHTISIELMVLWVLVGREREVVGLRLCAIRSVFGRRRNCKTSFQYKWLVLLISFWISGNQISKKCACVLSCAYTHRRTSKTYSRRFCSCCSAFKWFLNTVSASLVSNTSNGIRVSSSQSLTSLKSVHGACSHSKKYWS